MPGDEGFDKRNSVHYCPCSAPDPATLCEEEGAKNEQTGGATIKREGRRVLFTCSRDMKRTTGKDNVYVCVGCRRRKGEERLYRTVEEGCGYLQRIL